MKAHRFVPVLALLLTASTTADAMSGRPRGLWPKSWEVFVLPHAGAPGFALFPYTEGLKHAYDVTRPPRRADSVEEMVQQIAELPRTRWISFQYHDARLPEQDAAALQARLSAACRAHGRQCVFAL